VGLAESVKVGQRVFVEIEAPPVKKGLFGGFGKVT